jgi:hypothetical protein
MANSPLLKNAWRILEKYQIWWDTWDDVREQAHAGNSAAAKDLLVDENEFKPNDADHIVEWLKACIHGPKVDLVEIPVSAIRWFSEKELIDDEDRDPFQLKRYFARRGVDIAYLETSGTAEDDIADRKVFFQGKALEPAQLDQVWEIVPVE